MGQQSLLLSNSIVPPSGTPGTYYRPIVDGSLAGAWDTNYANVWQPCPVAGGGTLDYLLVAAQNSMGGKFTFTIMKSSGGSVTATALTVTPSGATGGDTTDSATFAQGDLWCMRCVIASGASSSGNVTWQTRFTAPSANQSLVLGGMSTNGTSPSNTVPNYGSLLGCAGSATINGPIETQPCAGTYKNLYVYLPTSVATGSWTIAYQSGANAGSLTTSSLSAAITSGHTGNDTTHTVAATAGLLVATVMTPASTPTAQTAIFWGLEFDPTTDGQSIGAYDITPIPNGTFYNSISGSDDVSAIAQVQNVIMGGFTIQSLYAINPVPTATGTIVFTLMQNGSATALTATVASSGSTANDTTHNFTTSDYDLIAVRTVNNGSVNVYPAMGVVLQAPATITLAGIPSAEVFGSNAVSGQATITDSGIPSAEAFGSNQVSGTGTITLSGISSAESFGTTQASGTATIALSGIPTAEVFGSTLISGQATVTLSGLFSAEFFGFTSIAGIGSVNLAGVPSSEAFGSTQITGQASITLSGIGSAEVFGSTQVGGQLGVTLTGIPSAEAFGSPSVSGVGTIATSGISSAESFGSTGLSGLGAVTITGIPSDELFGATIVSQANVGPDPGHYPDPFQTTVSVSGGCDLS